MKIYQVGGSVRDKLMHKEPHDIDYVVTQSTVEEMLSLGYKQVGKSFPVFLHPETKCEYALARKEIKTGDKHTDFEFIFTPDITLEEDMARRDFTCNAIAMDVESGKIIDCYGGVNDIASRTLRHVNSEHFPEDPLRVLRMCRFAAQLDFRVAPETMELASTMVSKGMLSHLSGERIWQEIYKAMQSKNFDIFITTAKECGALKAILPEVDKLFTTPEKPEHHPEKNSGDHTLLCLKNVALESPKIKFAVLLHDIGKSVTPKDILPAHHYHDRNGIPIISSICNRLRVPNEYRDFAILCCRHHMKLHLAIQMRKGTLTDFVDSIKSKNIEDFIKVCRADFYGRQKEISAEEAAFFEQQSNYFRQASSVIKAIKAQDMPNFAKLPKDKSFKDKYREYKINRLSQALKSER